MHSSIRLVECPVEFINVTPVNPLISKCQIKVCYVGDTPNRNRSIITKEVAREMANSLPGSPIVGHFNEYEGDFEEHNRIISMANGKFEIKDDTRPYGFVDLNAKVWFAKYLDDDEVEREYLVTEGWLWTGQYPECRRIVENKGNNHSMELDEDTLVAVWSFDKNGKPKFFIINEAIISKLCVLGEENEPCFEGSHITAPQIQFSFEDGFKEQLFSMMKELKDLLQKGGAKVFSRYSVTIGDTLWNALYSYVEQTYPDNSNEFCSVYRIDSICEEGEQKFAVLQHRSDNKYYRLNFSINEAEEFSASETLVEITSTYSADESEPQFTLADVEAFEVEYAEKKKKPEEDKKDEDDQKKSDDNSEGKKSSEENDDSDDDDEDEEKKKKKFAKEDDEKKCPECGKPVSECTCEEDKKKKYSLDEIPEYGELQTKYSELEAKYNALKADYDTLEAKVAPLSEFKAQAEKKDKEAMIASFYMLSDEDKADVVANIDTYSLDDIEAKLSIICVRNKVSFDLDEDKGDNKNGPTVFNLDNGEDDSVPAWVKRAMSVAKTLK